MTMEEYKDRLLEIRVKVNSLLDNMGVKYSDAPEMLEKVLNIAMNGDLSDIKNGKVKTQKIISVSDYHASDYWNGKAVYM